MLGALRAAELVFLDMYECQLTRPLFPRYRHEDGRGKFLRSRCRAACESTTVVDIFIYTSALGFESTCEVLGHPWSSCARPTHVQPQTAKVPTVLLIRLFSYILTSPSPLTRKTGKQAIKINEPSIYQLEGTFPLPRIYTEKEIPALVSISRPYLPFNPVIRCLPALFHNHDTSQSRV